MDKTRILIVEDDLVTAKDIEGRLQYLGYEVTGFAKSGSETFRQIKKDTPDLVLVNVKLQGPMNGIEVADQIRTKLNIPVVYMTALSEKATLERMKKTDPFGFLSKPFGSRELQSVIETALHKDPMEMKIGENEKKLSIRNQQYETFLENDLFGVWRVDFKEPVLTTLSHKKITTQILETGYVAECNDLLLDMYGFKSKNEFVGKPIKELVVDREAFLKRLAKVAKNDFRAEMVDTEEMDSKGNIHYFRNSYFGYVHNQRLHWLWGFQLDITERKQADKVQAVLYAISEATNFSENLEDLYHLIHIKVCELMSGNNFYIALYNSADETLSFPYFIDEFEDQPESYKLRLGLTEYVLRSGQPLLASPEVFEGLVKKGEVESVGPPAVDWLGVPLKVKGRTIGVMVVQSYTEGVRYRVGDKDILSFISDQVAMAIERKRAEEALRESEERYRAIFEQAADSIVLVDVETGSLMEFNNRAHENLDYTREEFVKLKIPDFEVIESAEEVNKHIEKIRREGTDIFETKHRTKDGEIRNIQVSSRAISISGRDIVQSIWRDITDRKQAEEQIQKDLKEKEVLLKEIHHRVKNNLQVISSLIGLQAKHIKDKQALEMFETSKNRVRSMALVHEELYRSKDFTNIDFAKYIKNLTDQLVTTYIMDSGKIELDFKFEDVSMGIDQAIPIGLVINELVSNTLKYAFPPSFERKGKIEITFQPTEAGEIELIVKDNGVGIPKELDIRKTESLGMQLVFILAEDQLGGKVKLDRRGGTKFTIRFERT